MRCFIIGHRPTIIKENFETRRFVEQCENCGKTRTFIITQRGRKNL